MYNFIKMQSLGNDFIVMPEVSSLDVKDIIKICDRRIGVGCDQLILFHEALDDLDLLISFYNQDGSAASMCGNGLRCIAGWFFENNKGKKSCVIGVLSNGINIQKINCLLENNNLINVEIKNASIVRKFNTDLVNVGNLHKVILTEKIINGIPITETLIPHEEYNINYIKVIDDSTLAISTVERGVGPTWACGSGACASVLYAVTHGILPSKTRIKIINQGVYSSVGEELYILFDNDKSVINMIGSYRITFNGICNK